MLRMVLLVIVMVCTMPSLVSAIPSRETVRLYQAFLQHQGFDPGPINGIISSQTIRAIQAYIDDARTGDRVAMYHVGNIYAQGIGVPPDPAEAASWYRKAAERGLNEAQYALGILHTSGRGISRDIVRAYAWFYVAAQGNNIRAERYMSRLDDKMSTDEHERALRLGKQLFEICSTSVAQ